jgi:hypothetical protein
VHDELEITLKQALHEKMAAEAKLAENVKIMVEHDLMFEEIDGIHMHLREEHRTA